MGTNLSHEQLIELDLGIVPEAAVSGALVLQSESSTFVTFNAMRADGHGRRVDAGTAVIEFRRCLLSRFGLPNDEALPGHPLARLGLKAYGAFEVLNSSWRAEAEAQNRVCFPATDYSEVRHFILTFHDSSFECLAVGLDVRLVEAHGTFRREFDALVDRVFKE